METSSTADAALQILLHLRDSGMLRIDELVALTGNSRTSVSRLLATLERRGFVIRVGKAFALGSVMASFGQAISPSIRNAARQPLADLAKSCEETVILALREGHSFVIVDQTVSRNWLTTVRYTSEPSQLLTVAAHGRAMLAYVADADYSSIRDTHPDPMWLDTETASIRRRRMATSSGELEQDVVGAASAILDDAGDAVASIGLIAPANRADFEAWSDLVPAAAASVAASLTLEGSR